MAGSYAYTQIDYGQGAQGTYITGVNAAGVVTGFYVGGNGYTHGFTWSAGSFTSFDASAGAGSTVPEAINESGQVVENFIPASGANRSAFLREANGAQHKLRFSSSVSVQVNGLNKSGAVIGNITGASPGTGFLVVGSTMTQLRVPGATATTADAINEAGSVVGSFTDATGPGGYIYTTGTYRIFRAPHLNSLTISAIDNAGLVSGSFLDMSHNGLVAQERGFTVGSHGFRDFNPVWSLNTWISKAFAPGYFIGTMQKPMNFEGFVFKNGQGTAILPPGAAGVTIAGGTASGLVIGNYTDASDVNHGFIAMCPAAQAPCTD